MARRSVNPCDGAARRRDDAYVRGPEAAVHGVGAFEHERPRVCTTPDAAWTNGYAPTEGFPSEPGYRDVLRDTERPVPHPPVDALTVACRLTAIVSETWVGP